MDADFDAAPLDSALRRSVVVLAIMAVAVAMRLPLLLYGGLWRDQAIVYVELTARTFGEFMHRVIESDYHPPLYFVVEYGWAKIVGVGELSMNLLPFLFAIATVPAAFALGRVVGGTRAGYASAAIFAVSPMMIMGSDELLYPMMTFLSTMLALVLLRSLREPVEVWRTGALAVLAALVVQCHYTGLVYVPLAIVLTLCAPVDVRKRIALAGALLAGLCSFAVWVPVLSRQMHVGVPFEQPMDFAGKLAHVEAIVLVAMPAWNLWLRIVCFVSLTTFVILARNDKKIVLASSLLLPMAFVALFSTARNLLAARYALLYYGLFAAFAGFVATRALNATAAVQKVIAIAFGVLTLAVVVDDAAFAYSLGTEPKSGIRTMLAREPARPDTLYVIAPDYVASTFAYYARAEQPSLIGFARLRDPQNFRDLGYQQIWDAPDAVARALRAIATAAVGHRYIVCVIDTYGTRDKTLPFRKSLQLVAGLERRYELLGSESYRGRYENISVYHFAVHKERKK